MEIKYIIGKLVLFTELSGENITLSSPKFKSRSAALSELRGNLRELLREFEGIMV